MANKLQGGCQCGALRYEVIIINDGSTDATLEHYQSEHGPLRSN